MDDFAKAFSAIWPFFLIGALALAAIFVLLRSSIAGLKTAFDQLRQEQERLRSTLGEMDQRLGTFGEQHSLLANRMRQVTDEFEAQRQRLASAQAAAAIPQQQSVHDSRDDEALVCPPDSIDRFNAAADALSLVAKELESFDSRQAENWLRIKGDLDEQAFQLQRVQQHVDRLFALPPASATADSSAG